MPLSVNMGSRRTPAIEKWANVLGIERGPLVGVPTAYAPLPALRDISDLNIDISVCAEHIR